MKQEEIIERFYIQEKNKENVKLYYEYLSENNWNNIEKVYQAIPEELLSFQAVEKANDQMNFTNDTWDNIRMEEFMVHEKFTQKRRLLDKKNIISQSTPILPYGNLKSILSQESELARKDIISSIKQDNENRKYKILQIIAEGNVVICRMIIQDRDPQSGTTIKYTSNSYIIMESGYIIIQLEVPHFLSQLIQLGKIIAESKLDEAQEYIRSLKNLGII